MSQPTIRPPRAAAKANSPDSHTPPGAGRRERGGAGEYQGADMKSEWSKKSFEDCIEKVTYTQKIQRKDFLADGEYPIVSQEEDFINGYWNNKADLFKVLTPIVVFGDHTKVLKYVDFDFVLGADGVKILQPRDFLLPKFFHYRLQAANLDSLGYARHYKLLKELEIAYPARAEQQRIVGVLDEAFAGLATAQANAEKNLQNARALFASHLQSVFTQRGKGWVEKSLGETCEMYQPKTIGTRDLVADGPYPVFGANGVIGRYDKFNHEEPQLLITCRGATCGSVNISQPKSWITGNAMVVRPLDHSLDLKFLEFVFRGGIDISKAITGAAQPQITRTNLSPLLIRFPKSSDEQKKLAAQFENLTDETQRLESLYEQKLAALAALKKSLLHQAFSGVL
jgi:type I restriction enzyme S subunit